MALAQRMSVSQRSYQLIIIIEIVVMTGTWFIGQLVARAVTG